MRKKILAFILFYLVCCFKNAFAAPAYGTKIPKQGKFFIGGQSYIVENRKLEKENGSMSGKQHFFLISYGLLDWLSIDLKGGVGNIHHHKADAEDLDYHSFLGGGYGFRVKFIDGEKMDAVFGFQHISVHPYTIDRNNQKYKAVSDDWQLSTIVSYDLEMFTPYIGAKFSRMDYIHWIDKERNLIKSDTTKNLGVLIGVDIPVNKKIWFNFEAQFLDVKAIAGSINISF
ncbi:MAG TPA: hypothetical protein PLH56_04220 [Candidatus Omnitrophota bacterium]|nr:hypothetical protein [Candidatus Omnitrophota bacterium]HPN88524.1 hypothetical protein [Candidatus Omnitrophota bacterium]